MPMSDGEQSAPSVIRGGWRGGACRSRIRSPASSGSQYPALVLVSQGQRDRVRITWKKILSTGHTNGGPPARIGTLHAEISKVLHEDEAVAQ